MKIKIDIEMTPQELRRSFGLPDVEPLQNELLEEIRRRMREGMAGFDPATLMAPFVPEHLRSLEALQRSFWEALARATRPQGS